jgi:hypothetical protein
MGTRYNSCTDQISLYYGFDLANQQSGVSYRYNVRLNNGDQRTFLWIPRAVLRINNPGWPALGAMAQICAKPFIGPSTCTRWSPMVWVNIP